MAEGPAADLSERIGKAGPVIFGTRSGFNGDFTGHSSEARTATSAIAAERRRKSPGGFDLDQCWQLWASQRCNASFGTDLVKMPLDPNKFYQKRSSTRQAVLLAVEWLAIIFTGMLAVLFLRWALALQLPSESASLVTESASNPPANAVGAHVPDHRFRGAGG